MKLDEAIKKLKEEKDEAKWDIEACRVVDTENRRIIKEEFDKLPDKIKLRFAKDAFNHYVVIGYGDMFDPFRWANKTFNDCLGKELPPKDSH